jgi:endonuclease III
VPPRPKERTTHAPKGTLVCPIPSTERQTFGLIQEVLSNEPFWLLVTVVLLNKTTGRSALPVISALCALHPTPDRLLRADHDGLAALIAPLGMGNQ